jgi:hypothetical protein
MLVTLVRTAAEMRNSFEDMKRLIAETEDVVITEVQHNTNQSIQKAISGPRPLPQSVKSLRTSTADDEDLPTKRRNVFKRALKGLQGKSTKDLANIERMLNQLLGEVEGLKTHTLPGTSLRDQYDDLDQEGNFENDHGYEPERFADTTTNSHASQSGHFSVPLSRGTSGGGMQTRKFSENRISTVPEGDEDELSVHEQTILDNAMLDNHHLSPVRTQESQRTERAGSVPLGTPPRMSLQTDVKRGSLSQENTPQTATKSKHKSSSSFSNWNPIPKISRWSETTASTVVRGFGKGKRDTYDQHINSAGASRSGSRINLNEYDHDPYGGDKLHSGFSQTNLAPQQTQSPASYSSPTQRVGGPPGGPDLSLLTNGPMLEDPKYKAHRDSLNLQHPQPRPGQQYQSNLERGAVNFDQGIAPQSPGWGDSQTSLNRLPQNANLNRYSAGTTGTDPSVMGESRWLDDKDVLPSGLAPARPPKEPLNGAPAIPPKNNNRNSMAKASPLAMHQSNAEDYDDDAYDDEDDNKRYSQGTASSAAYQGSPRAGNKVLGGLSAAPARRPTGPRAMGSPRAGAGLGAGVEGDRGKSMSPTAEQYSRW